jgi:hypothetical protein
MRLNQRAQSSPRHHLLHLREKLLTARLLTLVDIFNNSDGATDVVVDIVGYFYAPQAPDCLAVTQTASPGSGASFSATAVCATGYRITMGGCSTSATVAGTDWQSVTFNGTNDGWTCAGKNNTGVGETITNQANCCRKPGR